MSIGGKSHTCSSSSCTISIDTRENSKATQINGKALDAHCEAINGLLERQGTLILAVNHI
jgi:hypothetical protein